MVTYLNIDYILLNTKTCVCNMGIKALTFLKVSAIISKIGNYFYMKHVKIIRDEQRKRGLR